MPILGHQLSPPNGHVNKTISLSKFGPKGQVKKAQFIGKWSPQFKGPQTSTSKGQKMSTSKGLAKSTPLGHAKKAQTQSDDSKNKHYIRYLLLVPLFGLSLASCTSILHCFFTSRFTLDLCYI